MKKIMHKYFALTVALLVLPFNAAFAGTSQNEAAQAQVQDEGAVIETVLSKLPAETMSDFNALMQELADIGRRGVEILAGKLVPVAEGQNSVTEYALNGLVAYVSAEGREALAAEVRAGLRSSIDACADKVNKAFLMTQLQLIGKADDAPTYVKYLDDEELKPYAISGLIAIPDDGDAVAELIGKSGPYDEGLAYLAAKKGLEYPKNSSVEKDEVAEARALLNSDYSHERVNGLYLLLYSGKASPRELVLEALRDSDREYRAAALFEANDFADETFYSEVAALVPDLDDEAKVDVFNWFGDNHVTAQTGLVVEAVSSQNSELARAAIRAAGKLGGDDALKALADCMTGPYGEDAVTALASFRADVTDIVMTALNGSPETQALALELAGLRHVTAATPKVFELTEAKDDAVSKAAYKALAGVCTSDDFDRLCALLDNCAEEHAPAVKAAIVVSVRGLSDEAVAALREAAWAGSGTAFFALLNINADLTADLLALAGQNEGWRDEALSRLCVLMDEYVPAAERGDVITKGLVLHPSTAVENKLLTALGDSHDPAGIAVALGYVDVPETAEAAAYAIKTILARNSSLLADENARAALIKARDVYSALSASSADAAYAVDEIDGLLTKL